MSFLEALTSAILPVLSIAGVGYVLGTYRDVDVDPLSTVTIYVLTPALVFHSLVTTPIEGGTAIRLVVGVGLFTVAMIAVGEAFGRALGEREPILGAFVLMVTFPNAGNYGIPLSEFAFGDVGRSTAVLYIAGQALLMYTVGVYVASRGQVRSIAGAARSVFTLPLVYAVLAALVARRLDVVPAPDTPAMQTLQLTGDAAIPVMLLMLGIQLATTTSETGTRRVGPAVAIKLLVAPFVGLAIAVALGLSGTVGRVFVLECAMPAAITPLMLTIEFGRERAGLSAAGYVSTAIFASTLASVLTLAVVIAVLQSDAVL